MKSVPRVSVVSASSADRFEVDDEIFSVFLGEPLPPPRPGVIDVIVDLNPESVPQHFSTRIPEGFIGNPSIIDAALFTDSKHNQALVIHGLFNSDSGDRLMGELSYNFDESCNELRHLLNQARMNNVYVPVVQTEASWDILNEQVNMDMDQLGLERPPSETELRDRIMDSAFAVVHREAEEEARAATAPAASPKKPEQSPEVSPPPEIKFDDSPISRTDSSDSMNTDGAPSAQKLNLVRMSTKVTRSGRSSPVMDDFKSMLPAGNSPNHQFRGVDQINGVPPMRSPIATRVNPIGGFQHLDPNDLYFQIRGSGGVNEASPGNKVYSPNKNPFISPASTPGNRSPGPGSPQPESKTFDAKSNPLRQSAPQLGLLAQPPSSSRSHPSLQNPNTKRSLQFDARAGDGDIGSSPSSGKSDSERSDKSADTT